MRLHKITLKKPVNFMTASEYRELCYFLDWLFRRNNYRIEFGKPNEIKIVYISKEPE